MERAFIALALGVVVATLLALSLLRPAHRARPPGLRPARRVAGGSLVLGGLIGLALALVDIGLRAGWTSEPYTPPEVLVRLAAYAALAAAIVAVTSLATYAVLARRGPSERAATAAIVLAMPVMLGLALLALQLGSAG